jgi:outer membrane immunogenic protein
MHVGVIMKKLLLAGVALTCLLGGSAFAADLPVKAKPIVCVACNWNGFYVGVNFGGSVGHDRSSDTASLFPPGTLAGVNPGVQNPVSATSYAQSPVGALGGGQIGFNWQTGHLVVGAEADWDWTNQRSSLQVNNFIASSVTVAPAAYALTDQQKIDWLATLRARLGWTTGYSLWYVTGGAAFGGVKSTSTFQGIQLGGANLFGTAPAAASSSSTKTGWTVGGGVETSLAFMGMGANHWSAKLEYLYVDLGSVNSSFNVPLTAVAGSFYTVASSSHINDHIIRAGLNYRFGGEGFAPPPSTPGPCPTCNWTGFYVGANVGGSIGHDRTLDSASLFPPGANSAAVTNPVTNVLHRESPVGWLGGGQAGFNWQTGHLVLGVEGDLDAVGQRDTFANHNFIASTIVVAPAVVDISSEQKIKSLATLRARLGWAENCFVWYVTGGGAWGRVQSNYTFQATQLVGGGGTFTAGPAAASFSQTKSGWTVGGGVETSLAWFGLSNRWSGKVEYLYVDLGSINNGFGVPVTAPTVTPASYAFSSSSSINDHIIRVGLNYHFGG